MQNERGPGRGCVCGRGCDRSPPGRGRRAPAGIQGRPRVQMGVSLRHSGPLPQMRAEVRGSSEPASPGAWGWRSAAVLSPTCGPQLPHLDRFLFHPRNRNHPWIHQTLVPELTAHAVTPVPPRGVPSFGGVPTQAQDGAWGPC